VVTDASAQQSGTPVASQRIAEVLAERILSGELAPGTRIKQDELAEELSTSRIPVREALRILQSRGLVMLRANAGAWVSKMDLHDLEMSYKVRERIEPLLLLDSLPDLTEADIDDMRAAHDGIERGADVPAFLELDRQLHWASYRRHRSPDLAAIVGRLWDTTQSYRRAFARLAGGQSSWIICSEHRLLIEAISADDHETAASVLSMHIRRTRLELRRHPELFPAAAEGDQD
jgi:DNA-binding GntR family transcriptional regulator